MDNRLRVLRAEHAWSQAELAERLGVSRQTVNAIETGKYDPSLPLAFRIARLFARAIEDVYLPVHQEFLTRRGIYILENVVTAELVADQAWEFMFVLGQARIKGTVQMIVNPVAIR